LLQDGPSFISSSRLKRSSQPSSHGKAAKSFAGESPATTRALLSDKCCIMSDMSSDRITIRVPQALGRRLRSRSRLKGQAESEVVREALESYLGQSGGERSAYELAEEAGLIGCVRCAPKDLSTDSRHFEGFGKDKAAKARTRKKL
jgi:predicted DNA-binding protein